MAKTVVNPFDELTFQEIYDGIKSQGYIERVYKDITTQLKNTKSYKNIMEVAEQNMFNNFNAPIQDVQSKKKKIQEIGLLASEYDYSISTLITKTIEYDAKFAVETFIKRLKTFKQMKAAEMSSPTKTGIKRPAKNIPEKTEIRKHLKINVQTRRKRLDDSDNEIGSSGSVSSVHTSELSSFEDEIVIPPENKTNGKNQKIISFKAVNQAYKSMMSTRKKTAKRGISTRKSPKSKSNGAVGTDSHKRFPKRIPKPNSRYSSGDN